MTSIPERIQFLKNIRVSGSSASNVPATNPTFASRKRPSTGESVAFQVAQVIRLRHKMSVPAKNA